MKPIKALIIVICVLLSCLSVYAQSVVIDDNSLSKTDDSIKECVREATDDFDAVINGNLPIHAAIDIKIPLPADGGTKYYIGKGYKLTIVKSLAYIGSVNGYYYGPIIIFDEQISSGNSNQISYVRFYSLDSFKEYFKQ